MIHYGHELVSTGDPEDDMPWCKNCGMPGEDAGPQAPCAFPVEPEPDEYNDIAYLEQEAEIAAARDQDHDIWNCDCTDCAVERIEARR